MLTTLSSVKNTKNNRKKMKRLSSEESSANKRLKHTLSTHEGVTEKRPLPPEIISLVASFLPMKKVLTNCMLVSTIWYDAIVEDLEICVSNEEAWRSFEDTDPPYHNRLTKLKLHSEEYISLDFKYMPSLKHLDVSSQILNRSLSIDSLERLVSFKVANHEFGAKVMEQLLSIDTLREFKSVDCCMPEDLSKLSFKSSGLLKLVLKRSPLGLYNDKRIYESRCITHLNIESCGASLDGIGNMKQLTYLNISHNSVNSKVCESLSQLDQLKTLIVNKCELEKSHIPYIKRMSNLTRLDMGCNNVGDSISHLAELKNLTHLDLHSCMIERFWRPQGLSKLVHLNVSGNSIRYMSAMCCMRDLKYIDISHNKVKNLLGHIPKGLHTFIANRCELTSLQSLRKLDQLAHLEIAYNPVKDASDIMGMPALCTLYIVGTHISRTQIGKLKAEGVNVCHNADRSDDDDDCSDDQDDYSDDDHDHSDSSDD